MKIIPPQAQSEGAFARASTATYVSDAGVVTSAAVDEARFQAGALLLEPAATNLFTYSSAFDNAAWTKLGCDVPAPDAVVAPDGTTSAEEIVETTATTGHYLYRFISCTAGLKYTVSAFFKAGSGTRYPQLVLTSTAFGATLVATFDLAQGRLVTNSAALDATMRSIGGGWWRCTATATATATTAAGGFHLRLSINATAVALGYLGDGASSIAMWGAQLEVGPAATSYIPTTSATGTRAADVFTRGMLSNVPETDFAAYAGGSTYALGDRVILTSTHRVYESLQAGNTGHPPDASPSWWLDVGPTNRWAMFDAEYSTATALAAGPLRVVLAPAYANSIALLGVVGTGALVTVTDGGGAEVVYSVAVDLYNPTIVDWYGYVFEPFGQGQEVTLTDLPPLSNAVVTVTITGAPAVGCALMALGAAVVLGGVNLGVRLGIIDYSRKNTDEFGVTSFVKRAFSRRLSFDLLIENDQLDAVYRSLSSLRATPCVWVLSDQQRFQVLVLLGFFRDFNVTIAYQTQSQCDIEVEGLT